MSKQEYKLISLALIDDPVNPMRLDVNDDSLDDLVASINENGLLQPIIVRVLGDRYQLIAGHRRLSAYWRLHRSEIPCMVLDKTDDEALASEVAENLDRKETDPVSEAVMISRAMKQFGCTPLQLAEKIHRSFTWVNSRLAISSMPDYLQQALLSGDIKIGVALALNLVWDDNTRRRWTDSAVRSGMTVSAAEWAVTDWLTRHPQGAEGLSTIDPAATPEAPPPQVVQCARCGGTVEVAYAHLVWLHREACPS